MKHFIFTYKVIRFLFRKLYIAKSKIVTLFLFKLNGVNFQNYITVGVPFISVTKNGIVVIGNNFKMNNTKGSNPIGREAKCSFVISNSGVLRIGNNVGMSGCSIVCANSVQIDDNVKIGGNTCIYDTDFHSLAFEDRINFQLDKLNTKTKKVHLKKNSFIGAHTLILKGVTVGENGVVGAGSTLTKSIPENQIWAGNPAIFIKNLNNKPQLIEN